MENTTIERSPRPGFSISEKLFGDVLTFSFNLEFAQKLSNVMGDLSKIEALPESSAAFFKELNYLLDESESEPEERKEFLINRYNHTFIIGCNREFAFDFSSLLDTFLTGKTVSPSFFSFVKQLQSTVMGLPRFRKDLPKQRYADES